MTKGVLKREKTSYDFECYNAFVRKIGFKILYIYYIKTEKSSQHQILDRPRHSLQSDYSYLSC